MQKNNRILLSIATAMVALPAYGTYRFHSSQYEPKCEHLPGVCILGRDDVLDAQLSTVRFNGYSIQKLYLGVGSDHLHVNAEYSKAEVTPYEVSLGEHWQPFGPDEYEGRRQREVVIGPFNNLLSRGESNNISDILFWIPYVGLKEIFLGYRPAGIEMQEDRDVKLSKRCICTGNHCSKDKYCQAEESLIEASQGRSGYWRRLIVNAMKKPVLESAFDSGGSWNQDNADLVATNAKSLGDLKEGSDNFPRRYDILFGLSLLGLAVNGHLGPSGIAKMITDWIQKVRKRMDDKKEEKRKELEKVYQEKMDDLFRRLAKVTTLEECRKIMQDLEDLTDMVIKQDRRVFDEEINEYRRLSVAIDGKFELLGSQFRKHRYW